MFNHRYDDDNTLKYFTVNDFKDLQAEEVEFTTQGNNKLRGYLYSSTNYKEYKALLVLSHGLGAGHLQYTTEINYFAQKGYLVLGFDNTGCNLSEGKGINCLTYAALDLKAALEYVSSNEKINQLPILLYGHSLGAFAVCNVTEICDVKVSGIVALAPFINEIANIYDRFTEVLKRKVSLIKFVLTRKLHKKLKGKEKLNTINSLLHSDVPHLIISGALDRTVDYHKNFLKIKEALKDKDTCKFLKVENRYHRPNLTLRANDYDKKVNDDMLIIKTKASDEEKRAFFDNLDYNLLVEMDDEVMDSISNFYEECLNNKKE